jgi:hypothetical protein
MRLRAASARRGSRASAGGSRKRPSRLAFSVFVDSALPAKSLQGGGAGDRRVDVEGTKTGRTCVGGFAAPFTHKRQHAPTPAGASPESKPGQRSARDRAQRFRAVPALGATAHHLEEITQPLTVDMDLDVVPQRRGGIVEGHIDFA